MRQNFRNARTPSVVSAIEVAMGRVALCNRGRNPRRPVVDGHISCKSFQKSPYPA